MSEQILPESTGGVTDHGALTGLGDDDHTQYATNTEFDDHSARHESGGADAVKLDDLAAPDDNTDLNATTGQHGLLPKLGGGSTNFLRADGSWAAPSGSGAPASVDYLVGTADAGLSAEIVVGTTPGGELGGTWASPTVDATHSGSAHHSHPTKYDPDAAPATAAAVAEEFDAGALSSGWAWGTAPATVEDYTSYPHYGYFQHTTGNHWLAKAWTPGAVDVTIAAKFYISRTLTNSTDASSVMLGVADATGTDPSNGVFATLFPKQAGASGFQIYNRNTGSFAAVGAEEALTGNQHSLRPVWLMLQRTNTGPVWRAYISFNGITWMQHETTGSKALTIGAVSLRLSDQAQIVAVDWIRAWNSLITKVGA